jgi:hypothetical protein
MEDASVKARRARADENGQPSGASEPMRLASVRNRPWIVDPGPISRGRYGSFRRHRAPEVNASGVAAARM